MIDYSVYWLGVKLKGDHVMMKQVKWNKKRKWINTRYAKPYKARLTVKRMLIAQAYAIGAQTVRAAASKRACCDLSKSAKVLSMAEAVLNTQKTVINIYNS